MGRPRLWLVVVDETEIAHVVRKTAGAILGAYALRTEEHARRLAERLNDGKVVAPESVVVEPAVEDGP